MKVLGMVNKYNRGIAKANQELEKNGNTVAQFDVSKLTEFRVTIMPRLESGRIKPVKAYDTEGQDCAVLDIVRRNPGIKLAAIFLEIRTSKRSVRRVLGRLATQNKIEYRSHATPDHRQDENRQDGGCRHAHDRLQGHSTAAL